MCLWNMNNFNKICSALNMSLVSKVLALLWHQEVDLNTRIHKTIVSQRWTMKRFLEFAFL